VPTPNIDSIARNGIRFTSGYVSWPHLCADKGGADDWPLFSSGSALRPIPVPKSVADPHFWSGPEGGHPCGTLEAVGICHGMFGKWHIGYKP